MRLIELSQEERAELIRQHRYQGDDAKAADKIKAILLLAEGYSRQQVAHILLRDEDTITKWKETYKTRQSLADWFNEDYSGYPGKLDSEQLKAVEVHVENNIIVSAQSVGQWIQEQCGITYGLNGVHALLHRLGFTYKQSKPYPSKLDTEAQALFKEMYKSACEQKKRKRDSSLCRCCPSTAQYCTQRGLGEKRAGKMDSCKYGQEAFKP